MVERKDKQSKEPEEQEEPQPMLNQEKEPDPDVQQFLETNEQAIVDSNVQPEQKVIELSQLVSKAKQLLLKQHEDYLKEQDILKNVADGFKNAVKQLELNSHQVTGLEEKNRQLKQQVEDSNERLRKL